MINRIDVVFARLSGPYAWIAALAALIFSALALALWRRADPGRRPPLAVMLLVGLGATAALAAPYILNVSRPRSPSGPFNVRQAELTLAASDGASAPPILMQVWFPANVASMAPPRLDGCAALRSLPLATAYGPRRIVLYLPHFRGQRDDNRTRLAYLASHGYVVLAFDDIAFDPPDPDATPLEEAARTLPSLDIVTQAAYTRAVVLNDVRLDLEAKKALSALDRLTACAIADPASPWGAAVDYRRVGFLGFSSGGAAAAEAGATDPRVAAVVDLDGVLAGRALRGGMKAPMLYVMSDRPIPDLRSMNSKDPLERYTARINARDVREQARLAARPGSAGILIRGSEHASLRDLVYEPHISRIWILKNPIAFARAIDEYTLGFFDARLRGAEAPAIDQRLSTSPVVRTFQQLGLTPGGDAAWPPPQDANGAPIP